MTGAATDPLALMRARAKLVWTIGWVLFTTVVIAQTVAFSTAWIYGSFLRMATLPIGCFLFLGWMLVGCRWALSAAPPRDQLHLPHVGPFTKKVLAVNGTVVFTAVIVWSVIERSVRPFAGAAILVVLAALAMLGISAVVYGGYVGSLYSRPKASSGQSPR